MTRKIGTPVNQKCMQSQTKEWVRFLLSDAVKKNTEYKVGEFFPLAVKNKFKSLIASPYPRSALLFLVQCGLYEYNNRKASAGRWKRIGDALPDDIFPKKAPKQTIEYNKKTLDWHPDWAIRIEQDVMRLNNIMDEFKKEVRTYERQRLLDLVVDYLESPEELDLAASSSCYEPETVKRDLARIFGLQRGGR